MRIPHSKHVLENGLSVVLHEDHAQPVVAVHLVYHVGSSRERQGLSGFAHLFEHMLFQGSAHVPEGGHFRLVQEAGGTLNGTTGPDRTSYYEVLPSHQLELALWLEADRMGFLLPAMTQAKLDNQRDVVKNERRQSYENRPYGLVHETVLGLLFPAGHPYHHPTIGSMADIDAAGLEDVSAFFQRWYGPNNASLAIGGDLDPERTLAWVERWFGAIPRGPSVDAPGPEPVRLEEDRRDVLEDRITQPQLTMVWPTVPFGSPDEHALDLLTDLLSADKASLLDRRLTIEEPLATDVLVHHSVNERAGWLRLDLRPHAEVELGRLEERVLDSIEALARRGVAPGAEDGVDPGRLERLKSRREGGWMRALETVARRTRLLAHDDALFGDPGRHEHELERLREVTPEDVLRVAREYLSGRPKVVLSTVPRGERERAARPEGSAAGVPRPRGSGSIDAPAREEQPAAEAPPPFRSPPIEHVALSAGAALWTTPFQGVPLTRLALSVDAGRLRETPASLGLAPLTAQLLGEGTERRSSVELTDHLDGLGAELAAYATEDELTLELSVLDERLSEALEVLFELLHSPRFDAADVERLRRRRLVQIGSRADRPPALADELLGRILFPGDGPKGASGLGTRASQEAVEADTVRAFWRAWAIPAGARLVAVGAMPAQELAERVGGPFERWGEQATSAAAAPPAVDLAQPPEPAVFLFDHPGAAQAELRVGHRGPAREEPDYERLGALNHVLGGSFSSRINLNLRERRGYTYGARSGFVAGRTPGRFTVAAAVETRHVADAAREVRRELEGIREGVTDDELAFTRRSIALSAGRALESTTTRLRHAQAIAKYGLVPDHVERFLAWLAQATNDDMRDLAQRHVRPEHAVVVVVGDGAQLRGPLEELGWGPVVSVDVDGRPA